MHPRVQLLNSFFLLGSETISWTLNSILKIKKKFKKDYSYMHFLESGALVAPAQIMLHLPQKIILRR